MHTFLDLRTTNHTPTVHCKLPRCYILVIDLFTATREEIAIINNENYLHIWNSVTCIMFLRSRDAVLNILLDQIRQYIHLNGTVQHLLFTSRIRLE